MSSTDYLKAVAKRNLSAAAENRSPVVQPIVTALTACLGSKGRWRHRNGQRTDIRYSKLMACCVGFEVLTAMVMKSSIFWDIMPCNSLKVNRRFRGTYHLHFQGLRISRE
jgi:hypothetical protein